MGRIVRHILFLVATVSIIASVYSCNDDGCEGNSSSLPLAGFYSSSSKKSISVDSISVYGIGMVGDTTLINCGRSITQTYLPLNISDTVSNFVFRYDQKALAQYGVTDTLSIVYEKTPYFHSSDCGAMYIFDIVSYEVSSNLIDSVQFATKRIDNTNAENIKIFFRVKEEGK